MGGGDLLFRFASSVQSCCGEGGALQTDIAVCGDHSPYSGHTGFAPYRGVCAFLVYTSQAPSRSIWSGPCADCGSSFRVLHKSADLVAPAFCVFPGLIGSGSQRLGALSAGAARLFPPRRAARAARGLGALSPGAARLFPPRRAAQAATGLRALFLGAACLFPARPQRAPPVGCLQLAFVQRSWPLAATLPVADSQEFFRCSLDFSL